MPSTRAVSRLAIVFVLAILGTAVAAFLLSTRRSSWSDTSHPPPPLEASMTEFEAGNTDVGLAQIERFLKDFRATAWESRARVLAAVRLAEADRPERILAFLPDELPPDEPLAAHADLLRARSLLAQSRPADAAKAAARAATLPSHPWHEEALRVEAASLEASRRVEEALAILDGSKIDALRFEAARIAERSGDKNGARARLASLVLEAPAGDEAERAAEALFDPSSSLPHPRLGNAERDRLLAAARRWAEAGRVAQALDLLRSSRSGNAAPRAIDLAACVAEAELEIRLGRVPACLAVLHRAATGRGELADGARYLEARASLLRGRSAAYRSGLEAVARATGRSRFRLQALADLAQLAEGAPSAVALAAYRRYREAAGDLADPIALWREAWIALELGRAAEADAAIARVLARADAPDSVRMAALYWSGRRLEATGKGAPAIARYREAVERLPNHYYGMLAAKKLALPPPSPPSAPIPFRAPTGSPSGVLLETARGLASIGLTDLAIGAYRAAASGDDPARLAGALEGADVALEAGATADAVQLVQSAVGGKDRAKIESLPLRHLRLLVPAPTGKDLEAAARAERLDPWLVASVVLEESAFNPLAVSGAGARGLLQVMPDTGAELARRVGIRGFGPDRLFEPSINLRLGCLYLRGLVDRLDSVPVALAAYNAGPTRASRWTVPADGPDGERYVERIPVPDTRSYVKRILANVRLYRLAWPDGLDAAPR